MFRWTCLQSRNWIRGHLGIHSSALVPQAKETNFRIPLEIDTWHWVQTLSDSGLERRQAEAVLTVTTRILSHRLQQHLETLPRRKPLPPLLPLRTTALTPSRPADVTITMGEVHTELTLAVNEYRAEGREEGQRVEMAVHGEEGRLAAAMAAFRSDVENVKVRMVIFSILVIAMVERASNHNRPTRKRETEME
ncbi:hypothetical protein PSACC_01655 [Paramicrosporidium saccamoebae]|uniref:Uncharacterized protein n=1 Tax=Paramicrosporidium saccamoebae TaxID=1246581 RepID=A0A2H9TLB1_9FUNG|nr:hypothetical protein PSACC_01655 [Paramicrosporidium saccamoebae]